MIRCAVLNDVRGFVMTHEDSALGEKIKSMGGHCRDIHSREHACLETRISPRAHSRNSVYVFDVVKESDSMGGGRR